MASEKKGEKKKGAFERFTEWGYKWQMKPYKMMAKSVTEGIKEGASEQEKPAEDPISILKLRLARGEISKEEYEELKKAIENR